MFENNEWLKELKAGDEIVIDKSNFWNKNLYEKVTVVKITPTGRIKTSDGSQFHPDGREIGGSSDFSPLREITPEILELIERRKLLKQLRFNEFVDLLSAERLRTLLDWQNELVNKQV